MATRVEIGKRTAIAIGTIESVTTALGNEAGLTPVSIPPVNRRGEPELRMEQLSVIAAWLESYMVNRVTDSVIPQHYLDAEQLAREGATKAEIVSALLQEDTA